MMPAYQGARAVSGKGCYSFENIPMSPFCTPSPQVVLAAAGLLLAGLTACSLQGEALVCEGLSAPGAPDASTLSDPDLSLYGYPRVAVEANYTPGQTAEIKWEGLLVSLPADAYTERLKVELLVSDARLWQACAGTGRAVLFPYAVRTTDPATGKRVGRLDKPAEIVISHPRIGPGAVYWVTAASSPVRVKPAGEPPQIEPGRLRVLHQGLRVGWFVTVPEG